MTKNELIERVRQLEELLADRDLQIAELYRQIDNANDNYDSLSQDYYDLHDRLTPRFD